MTKQKITVMKKLENFLIKRGYYFELFPGYANPLDSKIILYGYSIEETHERYYVMNEDGDDIYNAKRPESVINFIEKVAA